MYLTATGFSFFAPSVISKFSSERKALATFAFEFMYIICIIIQFRLFVCCFAFNYPILIIVCSIIHGACLSVILFYIIMIYSVSGLHKVCILD